MKKGVCIMVIISSSPEKRKNNDVVICGIVFHFFGVYLFFSDTNIFHYVLPVK